MVPRRQHQSKLGTSSSTWEFISNSVEAGKEKKNSGKPILGTNRLVKPKSHINCDSRRRSTKKKGRSATSLFSCVISMTERSYSKRCFRMESAPRRFERTRAKILVLSQLHARSNLVEDSTRTLRYLASRRSLLSGIETEDGKRNELGDSF
ncbi:hypothetical protein CDAR_25531 [Caerostris darwini]|uniref:Uncharacterized protein n=1 Tax=Caerostris darwini TaxID=1538125 RepID=A0AAV4TYP8_9ARAC|nr:hypothetical protein CDAR_25531 [Caerostris darwini]